MRNTIKFVTCWILFSCCMGMPLWGVNHVVELGQDIQTKVALANSGDVVIVRGGEYQSQTITVGKTIRLVREKDTNVSIGGTITYSDVNGTVVLRDFYLKAANKGRLVLTNCKKFGLQNITPLPEGISVTGSTVVIRDCNIAGSLAISGASDVEMINSICGNITVNGSAFHAESSSFGTLTVTNNSNLTLVDSNFSTATFTGGKAFLRKIKATGNVTFTQCDWQDHGSTFNENLTSNQSHTRLSRSTVKKAFTHGHPSYGGKNLDCVIFQCTIGRQTGALLHSKANRTWVTYSTIHHALQEGGVEAHFVGNDILTNINKVYNGVNVLGSNCVASIYNNHFYNGGTTDMADASEKKSMSTSYSTVKTFYPGSLVKEVKNQIKNEHSSTSYRTYCKIYFFYTDGSNSYKEHSRWENSYADKVYTNAYPDKIVWRIEVRIKSSHGYHPFAFERNTQIIGIGMGHCLAINQAKMATVQNNLFRNINLSGHGIFAPAAPTDGLFVKGNAFWRSSGTWTTHAVNSPKGADRMIGNSPVSAPDICSHNYFQDSAKGATGGIVSTDNITGADPGFVNPASDWSLTNESILKDKGPTEAHFNDHDGSRNDIGYSGGHRYDTNGRTATAPVVLTADQSVYRLSKGSGTPVMIKARAAVSTP